MLCWRIEESIETKLLQQIVREKKYLDVVLVYM